MWRSDRGGNRPGCVRCRGWLPTAFQVTRSSVTSSMTTRSNGESCWPYIAGPAGERRLQRPPDPARRLARVFPVDEGGRALASRQPAPGPGPQSGLDRVRRRPYPHSRSRTSSLLDRARRRRRRRVPDPTPRLGCLHQQFQRRHHHQDPAMPIEVQRGGGSGVRLPGTRRRHNGRPSAAPSRRGTRRHHAGSDNPPLRFHLVLTELDHDAGFLPESDSQAIDRGGRGSRGRHKAAGQYSALPANGS